MYAIPDYVNYMTSVNKNRYEDREVNEINVDTVTLSSFIQREKISRVDLIKIDVEEHENEVLEGFEPYITSMNPYFLIEIIGEQNAKKIQDLFSKVGYLFFLMDEINEPRKVNAIKDFEHHNYLICLPELAQEIGLI